MALCSPTEVPPISLPISSRRLPIRHTNGHKFRHHAEPTPLLFLLSAALSKPVSALSFPPRVARLRTRCRSSGVDPREPSQGGEEMVSGMVEELLRRDENKQLLDGLDAASERVERARAALADIERQEADVLRAKQYMLQLQSREAEIAETQKELLEARGKVEEAERFLSSKMVEQNSSDSSAKQIDKGAERSESVKAAVVSSVVGVLASLPLYLYQDSTFPQLALHLALTFFSCSLFGVTFRYTVRQDLDSIQLKTGAVGAFGLVKGLAAVESGKALELSSESIVAHLVQGTISASESIFIFLSASIALDFCFKMGLLSPFPMRK